MLQGGDDLFTFPGLTLTQSTEESKALNMDPSPKIIISASGMCDAGRIRHHLKHNLWRPECAVVFVGYRQLQGAQLPRGPGSPAGVGGPHRAGAPAGLCGPRRRAGHRAVC